MQTRPELVLMFMLALSANSSVSNPNIVLGMAQQLADAYLGAL